MSAWFLTVQSHRENGILPNAAVRDLMFGRPRPTLAHRPQFIHIGTATFFFLAATNFVLERGRLPYFLKWVLPEAFRHHTVPILISCGHRGKSPAGRDAFLGFEDGTQGWYRHSYEHKIGFKADKGSLLARDKFHEVHRRTKVNGITRRVTHVQKMAGSAIATVISFTNQYTSSDGVMEFAHKLHLVSE